MGHRLGQPFRIRDFSFDADRTWRLSPERPFYFPVTFMAPELANARDVIGYDVYADRNFRAAVDRSGQLGDPVATLPFALVEGGRGYIYLRALDQRSVGGGEGAGTPAHLISLLIRVDRLLGGVRAPAGGVLTLRHRDAKEPAVALLGRIGEDETPAASNRWELRLPARHLQRAFPSSFQPFVLDLLARPHWSDFRWRLWLLWVITWSVLVLAALTGTLTLLRALRSRRLAQAQTELARHDLSQVQSRAEVLRERSLHELGSGIAHELNQPLAAVAAYSQAALRLLAGPTPPSAATLAQLRETLHANAQQALRAGELMQRLRNLVGKQPVQTHTVVMHDVVANAVRLEGSRIAAANVGVETLMPAGRVQIVGDFVLLEQMLTNLLRNAAEALASAACAPRRIVIELGVEASQCSLSVSDNGPGMSAEQLARAFQPFHSTKPGGLGIGLVVCATIVQAHGGEIVAQSASTGGARLVVTPPLPDPAILHPEPAGAS